MNVSTKRRFDEIKYTATDKIVIERALRLGMSFYISGQQTNMQKNTDPIFQ